MFCDTAHRQPNHSMNLNHQPLYWPAQELRPRPNLDSPGPDGWGLTWETPAPPPSSHHLAGARKGGRRPPRSLRQPRRDRRLARELPRCGTTCRSRGSRRHVAAASSRSPAARIAVLKWNGPPGPFPTVGGRQQFVADWLVCARNSPGHGAEHRATGCLPPYEPPLGGAGALPPKALARTHSDSASTCFVWVA